MENRILELLYELKRKTTASDDAFMLNAGLSHAEFHLLVAIHMCNKLNSNALAKKMNLSLSRTSRVIDKMVNNGYMTRETLSSDRRAIKLELTDKGKELMDRVIDYRKKCELRILENVSEDELHSIKKSLETVLRLM